MDQHVPAAITVGLRQRGVDVLTAQEDGTSTLDDEPLLARATSLNRVLFTQDQDFLVLAHAWHLAGRPFAGVVFARQIGVTVRQAIEGLELIALASDPADVRSQVYYLPL
jgi:predicted nuclease of predicted toxin-antitoxin system